MKKIKKYGIFLLVISIAMNSLVIVNAQNNAILGESLEERKSYYLEDLIKDEKEQNDVKKMFEESESPISKVVIPAHWSLDGVALSTGDTSVNAPFNATLLDNVDGENYLWYVTQLTSATSGEPVKIYRHNITTNANEEVFTSESNISAKAITYYYNNNVLYVLYIKNYDFSAAWGYEYATSSVVGINIKTGKEVFNKDFDTPQDCKYLPSFAVDNNERFYFVYRSTGTRIFDKTGKLLYDHKPIEGSEFINFIKGVSPNGKALFFEVMYQVNQYAYFQSVYEGIQKLNNGVFEKKMVIQFMVEEN